MAKPQTRNRQIEGLRAIAILLVVIFHLFIQYRNIYDTEFTRTAGVNISTLGVTIFLLISGYYISNVDISRGVFSAIKKRTARLWPAYVFAITLIFVLTRFLDLPGRTVSLGDYLLNVVFVNGYIKSPYVDGAHWYITTLLSATVISLIIRKTGRAKTGFLIWSSLVFSIVMLLPCIHNPIIGKVLSATLLFLGGKWVMLFVLGFWLYYAFNKNNVGRFEKICPPLLTILYSSLCMKGNEINMLVVILISIVLFYFALGYKLPFLDNPVICSIGAASYSIYLLHQNIGFILIREMCSICGAYQYWMSLVAVLIMIGVGCLAYQYVEKPLNSLIKSYMDRNNHPIN